MLPQRVRVPSFNSCTAFHCVNVPPAMCQEGEATLLLVCLTAKPMFFVSSGWGRVTRGIRKGVQQDRGPQGGGRGKGPVRRQKESRRSQQSQINSKIQASKKGCRSLGEVLERGPQKLMSELSPEEFTRVKNSFIHSFNIY